MALITIDELRERAGKNKIIPAKYASPILSVLARYPELKNTRIIFKLADQHPVPYGTAPTAGSLFKGPAHRIYEVTLREQAEEPELSALFRNLPQRAQVAVIAHELGHVVQFQECGRARLAKNMVLYAWKGYRRKLERNADAIAIAHGFGEELYEHAVYIRSIPGYTRRRPEINKLYLRPGEIRDRLGVAVNSSLSG
jgi:hypothetical protein